MAIDLNLQADMDSIILQSGFQETVTYTPSGAAAKSISAVVVRGGGREGDEPPVRHGSASRQYDVEIWISTDATTGVEGVTPREDVVSLATTPGGSSEIYTVMAIIDSDSGAWHLGLGS